MSEQVSSRGYRCTYNSLGVELGQSAYVPQSRIAPKIGVYRMVIEALEQEADAVNPRKFFRQFGIVTEGAMNAMLTTLTAVDARLFETTGSVVRIGLNDRHCLDEEPDSIEGEL